MKNIYLASDSLTNGNQLAPYGVARVLRKIPITAGFGNVIYDNEILMNDANDVSIRHLRRLHFNYCIILNRLNLFYCFVIFTNNIYHFYFTHIFILYNYFL